MIRMRRLQPGEFGKAAAYYREHGYGASVAPADRFLVTEEDGRIVAVLRLCREEACLVLRGMRVSPALQRRGIGSRLLHFAQGEMGDEVCYCIPYRYLRAFYAQIGFEEVGPAQVPEFLRDRVAVYRSKLGLDVILMRRGPGKELK
jgi:N-acetylglutamate synthase-like GNAT family acetyltransferase